MFLRCPAVTVCALLLICSLFAAYAAAKCIDGWFGSRCQFKCHCRNVKYCDSLTGSCKDDLCAPGWFDEGCQYVDWTHYSDAPNWLKDGNDFTCNPDSHSDTLRITFAEEQVINRYKLIGKRSDALDVLEVTTYHSGGRTEIVSDLDHVTGGRTVEFLVEHPTNVAGYKFRGAGVKLLCSLYMTSGRNVALFQGTALSSQLRSSPGAFSPTGKELSDAYYAVDGNAGQDYLKDGCARTDPRDNRPWWLLKFDHLVRIYRITIYNIINNQSAPQRKMTFELQGYGEAGRMLFKHQGNFNGLPRYVIYGATPVLKSLALVFTNKSQAQICEFEAYGDTVCDEGKFGPECNYMCYCVEDTCTPSGWCQDGCARGYTEPQCLGCPEGFFDYPTCKLMCSRNCKGGCFNNGDCKDGCKLGTWGKSCHKNCSESCKENCDLMTGRCPKLLPDRVIIIVIIGLMVLVVSAFATVLCVFFCKEMKGETAGSGSLSTITQKPSKNQQPVKIHRVEWKQSMASSMTKGTISRAEVSAHSIPSVFLKVPI